MPHSQGAQLPGILQAVLLCRQEWPGEALDIVLDPHADVGVVEEEHAVLLPAEHPAGGKLVDRDRLAMEQCRLHRFSQLAFSDSGNLAINKGIV